MDNRLKKNLNRLQQKTKEKPQAIDTFVPALKTLMDQTEERQEEEGKFVNQSRHLNWFRTQTAKSYSGLVYDYTEEYEKHQAKKEEEAKTKSNQITPPDHTQTEATIEAEIAPDESSAVEESPKEIPEETAVAETVIDAEFSIDPHEQATQAIDAAEFLKDIKDE